MKQIRFYQIITAISCLFLISCGIDQNLKKADKHLSLGEYYDAATQYKKVYTKTPTKERAAREQAGPGSRKGISAERFPGKKGRASYALLYADGTLPGEG